MYSRSIGRWEHLEEKRREQQEARDIVFECEHPNTVSRTIAVETEDGGVAAHNTLTGQEMAEIRKKDGFSYDEVAKRIAEQRKRLVILEEGDCKYLKDGCEESANQSDKTVNLQQVEPSNESAAD